MELLLKKSLFTCFFTCERKNFMDFCSTSADSFPVLIDRAITFSLTSSCNSRPPFVSGQKERAAVSGRPLSAAFLKSAP